MDVEGPLLRSLDFSIFSPDEIRRLSVVEVLTPLALNKLGHPLPGGLYDLRMGPSGESSDICLTCKQLSRNCPGHFGHIELPIPVVNPLFHKALYIILRMSCNKCHRVLIPGRAKVILIAQLKLLEVGKVKEAEELVEVAAGVVDEEIPEAVAEALVTDAIADYLCKNLSIPQDDTTVLIENLRQEFINEALKLRVKGKVCNHCKASFKNVTVYQNRLMVPDSKIEVAEKFKDGQESTPKAKMKAILPSESRQMLRNLWKEESELLSAFFPLLKKADIEFPTDCFFVEALLVPPPKVRPLKYLNGRLMEGSQAKLYKSVLNDCIVAKGIRRLMGNEPLSEHCAAIVASVKGESPLEKLNQIWAELQSHVDHLLDIEMNKMTNPAKAAGLKQLIEKKGGILRMHMMGKRVNFAARSVITPDPNIRVEEIGIPRDFAMKLSFPEHVNEINVEELRKLVEAGPDVYPGATFVENENGTVVKLMGGASNRRKRVGAAKLLLKSADTEKRSGKIVHRHLRNGDMLLLNRQPTLHKPSIMAHRARILKGEKTVRMHYSNCKSYNADFDGDEMNVHFPQSELARSEAMHLASVPNQYLVPKDGTPLGGLIQDHIIAGVHLTVRGKFFNRHDYNQLVYQALSNHRGKIKLLPPCIVKPRHLWSGKQVISTVLLNLIPSGKDAITLKSKSKTSLKSWERFKPRQWNVGRAFSDPQTMSEAEVIIHRGHLLCGIIDKQHLGATEFSLTHCLFELYGGDCSSSFLNSLGRLFTSYLQYHGFTLGVADILVKPDADKERNMIIEEARKVGDIAAAHALDLEEPTFDLRARLEEAYFKDPVKFRVRLDGEYKKALDEYTNNINKVSLPGGLQVQFPKNNLQLMVVSGAKGSTVNTMQISCLLGQIELEGKRPPVTLSGRSLPSFRPFETLPKAGGYIDGRFMTGITPQDFFFHCMAGREGLIDTAVKTSRSGYLQRCLIKHLEGVAVEYDHTVRNHDGTVIQFAYGEDGMEVTKARFLQPKLIDFLYKNRSAIFDKSILKQQDKTHHNEITEILAADRSWRDGKKEAPKQSFTQFSAHLNLSEKYNKITDQGKLSGRTKAYYKTMKKWKKLTAEEKQNWTPEKRPDPVSATYWPHRDFGAICESLDKLIVDHVKTMPKPSPKLIKLSEKTCRNLVCLKSMVSLCPPGEPVGLLAAQSVGEPSTQMTLNTFHFAGRGEMNVTLGIPRLREILMTASKAIKTPSMDIPLLPGINAERKAEKLKRLFRRVTVADVLEKVTVKEKLQLTPTQLFTYTVRFEFLPHKCYKREFVVKPSAILKHMEKKFLILFSKAIGTQGKKMGDLIQISEKEKRRAAKGDDDDEDGNVDDLDGSGNAGKKQVLDSALGDDKESSDEEQGMDDDDATASRLRARHQEAREYDEPTDSEAEASEDEANYSDIGANEENENEEDTKVSEEVLKDAESRKNKVVGSFQLIKDYNFDMVNSEWCEFVIGVPVNFSKIDFSSLVRDVCSGSIISEIPGLRRAFVSKSDKGEVTIKTDGINLTEMFKFGNILNLQRLYSNDIHQIASTYGIEAAGRVVVRELQSVFRVYGITVDPRHLLLIADYMTVQGRFMPMNRTGMATSPSPLQQMSFESAVTFLRSAVFGGKRDPLMSPSARIMVGRACRSGTGMFQVIPTDTM